MKLIDNTTVQWTTDAWQRISQQILLLESGDALVCTTPTALAKQEPGHVIWENEEGLPFTAQFNHGTGTAQVWILLGNEFENYDFFMMESHDGGKTWERKEAPKRANPYE